MENMGYKVLVRGLVQCVGFRYYTSIEAKQRGLTGYAKNLANGDVEVIIYGHRGDVANMVKWLKNGPKTARVDKLDVSEITYKKKSGFLTL